MSLFDEIEVGNFVYHVTNLKVFEVVAKTRRYVILEDEEGHEYSRNELNFCSNYDWYVSTEIRQELIEEIISSLRGTGIYKKLDVQPRVDHALRILERINEPKPQGKK